MKKVLFVCTGNTCRSPMAMSIFNFLVSSESEGIDYVASSAGLSVYSGEPASSNAVKAVKELAGIDLAHHRAHMLSRNDVDEAFLILTMSVGHKNHIRSLFPDASYKVFTLKEYAYGVPEQNNSRDHAPLSGVHAASAAGMGSLGAGGMAVPAYSPDIADPYGGSPVVYKLCARELAQAVEKAIEKLRLSL